MAYTTTQGRVLVDRALYLPQEWLSNQARCQQAGMPQETVFQTKPQLALSMIEHALKQGLPVNWVTGDAVYGNNSKLRNWLESAQVPYVLGVSSQDRVTIGFEFWRSATLLESLPAEAWQRLSAGSGSQGERWYDWACVPMNHLLGPDWQRYLLVRRSIEKPQEVAFYRVFCKADTALLAMVHVAGQRWSVEQCFQLAKGETGLDQYEVRKWKGGYRQMTLSMLSLAFLAVQRARKKGPQTDELIPLSVPEIRKLLVHLLFRQAIHWSLIQLGSRWRRRHQMIAKQCHPATRLARNQSNSRL